MTKNCLIISICGECRHSPTARNRSDVYPEFETVLRSSKTTVTGSQLATRFEVLQRVLRRFDLWFALFSDIYDN